MKCVIQRVSRARVVVEGRTVGEIERGLLLLVGVEKGDPVDVVEAAARKIGQLRIFSDEDGKMNRSVEDVGGAILAVSQFTLAGSIEKGRRPSFTGAEDPDRADELFEHFVEILRSDGFRVETGEFGAMMQVELVNDGPVTFVYG
ncbi:MAG: D-aminoacyl-tRNA deacylase [Thermoanaerobaculia bacterium]|nr:D-aminoacyl-tRNA deacylase [Thermoanaerobaculia bacterium]